MGRILAVEDDELFSDALADLLRARGYEARCVRALAVARAELQRSSFDAVLLDLSLPDGRGIDLIRELRAQERSPIIVCLTAAAGLRMAVEAMRAGADDYIAKTETPESVLDRIEHHMRAAPGFRAASLRTESPRTPRCDELEGTGPAMLAVKRLVRLASETDTTVLLNGETGTGKSHIARLIHRSSARRQLPFVTVDCAALSESLAESELFGHERGAFTGAVGRHVGAIESAADGTLFFDEMADLPPAVQGKLLRVLEERVIRRVGGTHEIPVRARVLGATRRDLARMVAEGTFREDLYFRLTVLQITLPPLRERAEDIPALAQRLLQQQGHANVAGRLTPELCTVLAQHSFPGNIRELRNVVERIALMARVHGAVPGAEEIGLAPLLHGAATTAAVSQADAGVPREIGIALVASGGRIGEAARSLGMSRHALRRRLMKLRGDADLQPTG